MPLKINSPLPPRVTDWLPSACRWSRPTVNTLPAEVLTLRPLPSVIGALIVLLPPLVLSVAVPVAVLASVNVLPPDALIT